MDEHATTLVLNKQQDLDPGWAVSGGVTVGDESITYQSRTVYDNLVVLKEVTRGANASPHEAETTFVRYVFNTAELTRVVVAHECGHNLTIRHDTMNSVMNAVLGGTIHFYQQFRHRTAGEPLAGSTDEFTVK